MCYSLGNLWEEDILKLIVSRAGDDKSIVQFSSYFVCVCEHRLFLWEPSLSVAAFFIGRLY